MRKLFYVLTLIVSLSALTSCLNDFSFLNQSEYEIPDEFYHNNRLGEKWKAIEAFKLVLSGAQEAKAELPFSIQGSQAGFLYELPSETSEGDSLWTCLYFPDAQTASFAYQTHWGKPNSAAHPFVFEYIPEFNYSIVLRFKQFTYKYPTSNQWIFIHGGTKQGQPIIYKLHPQYAGVTFDLFERRVTFQLPEELIEQIKADNVTYIACSVGYIAGDEENIVQQVMAKR